MSFVFGGTRSNAASQRQQATFVATHASTPIRATCDALTYRAVPLKSIRTLRRTSGSSLR
jgi:hypothetical protein